MHVLHHEPVTAKGSEPAAWLYVLHGMYGAGRNWGTVSRRLVERRPDWGCLLIDLRQHGASQGFPPPHRVSDAAADLVALQTVTQKSARAVLGHSFGGKVALAYLQQADEPPRQVWVIDSTPEAGEPRGSAWEMLKNLRALPDRFESRDAAVNALTAAGSTEAVAQWMALNLVRADDGTFRWRFDLDAVEALLRDFFALDLWGVVEAPPPGADVHFVKATESSVLSAQTLERLEAAGPNVHVHTVTGGHWLNADNPDALVELLAESLPAG